MAQSKIEWTDKIINNFWEKVNKTDSCWLWEAGVFKGNGYGQFRVGDKKMKAHRVAYILIKGEIPEDKILCHSCDNRICVNPNHLTPADHKYNTMDMQKKGRANRNVPKPNQRGSKNHASKLSEDDVSAIIALKKLGYSYKAIAEEYNVSISAIAQIIRGKKWQHVRR